MNPKLPKIATLNEPWIALDRIDSLLQIEPAIVIVALSILSWLIYILLLKKVSQERHENMRELFSNLWFHLITLCILFGIYVVLRHYEHSTINRVSSYIGLVTLLSGATVFIKTWRILVFEYLFLSHMRDGVPVLLVNLSTLLLSMVIGAWFLTDIFNIRLAPLLATSAIFSIVLGLALQDTLGNLFAGVALQFDKPYEIGDWIEVHTGSQKWIGQVHEISWRATVLIGICEESLTIPNRVVSQAEISNYSIRNKPIIRSQSFKIPHHISSDDVRKILLSIPTRVAGVCQKPEPIIFANEINESWINYRLIYFLDDYGNQWRITDQVIDLGVKELQKNNIPIASQKLDIRMNT